MSELSSARAVSLFSGIGGFEYGMHDLGFEFLANLEFDRDCVTTLNSNEVTAGGRTIVPLDITKVSPAEFFSGEIDYIVGGPPCQSFSAAGRRAGGVPGIDDARGTLFWYYCQYVAHFRPKAFVFENVRGILSSKRGEDFEIICQSFKNVGYNLYWRVLNSADYGVPQFRERLYLVGLREDLGMGFKFPQPTYGPDSPDARPYVTALDAIGDLDDPTANVPPYGGKYGHLIPDIPEGENYRFFTEEMGHPNPQFAWRSKFSGFLYKMAREEPCRTIVSQQSRYDGPLHWRNRKCSPAELKRLQGFPDEMQIPHSYVTVVKQIGNSVTPPVARALGMALRFQIEKHISIPLLENDEKLTFDRRKGLQARKSRSKKVKSVPPPSLPSLFDEVVTFRRDELGKPIEVWMDGDIRVSSYRRELHRVFEIVGRVDSEESNWFNLSLEFVGEFQSRVRSVTVLASRLSESSSAVRLAWRLINQVVQTNSSYESLQPLWGHFTEPYPKFRIQWDSSRGDLALQLQEFMIARALDKDLVTFQELEECVGKIEDVISDGRAIGFDIRTHLTNRTIKPGVVRFCYPFPVLAG